MHREFLTIAKLIALVTLVISVSGCGKSAKHSDPYPFTLVISCGMGSIRPHIALEPCLSSSGSNTEIELKNGDDYGMYKVFNIPRDWEATARGLEVPLREHFSLEAQNAHRTLILGIAVYDTSGNVVFRKEAGQYGVISVSN